MSVKSLVPIVLPTNPVQPLEAVTKQYCDANAGGGGPAATPAVLLAYAATVAVAAAADPVLTWTEDATSTSGTTMDIASTSRLVANTEGWYAIDLMIRYSALGATARASGEVRKNSTGVIASGTRVTLLQSTGTSGNASGAVFSHNAFTEWFNAGDWIEVFANHNDADSANVDGGAITNTRVSMTLVGVGPKGDTGPTGSGSTIAVQEDGATLGSPQPIINFIGSRLTAADDAANSRVNVTLQPGLVYYHGSWSAAVFQNRDVVERYGARWIWLNSTPSLTTDEPGVGTNSWTLFSGTPSMTPAQITAWTGMRSGDTVWDTTNDVLQIRDVSWIGVNPNPILVQAALGNVASGTNDQTVRTLYTSAALPSAGLLTVNTVCYVIQTGTGVCEYYMIVELIRGGSSIGTIAASSARGALWATTILQLRVSMQWADARAGDTIRVNFNRVTAANTFQVGMSGVNNHGISYVLQPYV